MQPVIIFGYWGGIEKHERCIIIAVLVKLLYGVIIEIKPKVKRVRAMSR